MLSKSPLTFALVGQTTLLDACINLILRRGHKILAVIRQDSRSTELLPCFGSLAEARSKLPEPPDILLSISNAMILGDKDLHYARVASINYHDSPLPRYGGVNAPSWAILNGETSHGISWHLMTAEVDGGDLVGQREFELEANETSASLARKCFCHAVDSFEELLKHIEDNTLKPRPQPLEPRSYYGKGDRLPRGGFINWRDSGAIISRFVRSAHWGEQDNEFGTAKLLLPDHSCLGVMNAELLQGSSEQAPGTLVSHEADALTLIAGDHRLVRLSGLKPLERTAGGLAAIRPGCTLPELTNLQLNDVQRAGREAAEQEGRQRRLLANSPAPLMPCKLRLFRFREGQDYCFEKAIASQISLGKAVAPVIARLMDQHLHPPLLVGVAASPLPGFHPIRPCLISSVKTDAIASSIDHANQSALCATDLPLRFHDVAQRWMRLETIHVVISDDPDQIIANQGVLILCKDERLQLRICSSMISAEEAHIWGAYLLGETSSKHILAPEFEPRSAIVSQILEHASKRPGSIAVQSGEVRISYEELEKRTAQLASRLLEDGASPEARYAVLLPQSADFPVACLAILRAGAAFIPLDCSSPSARLKTIIQDASPLAIITDGAHLELAAKLNCLTIDIDDKHPAAPANCRLDANNHHPSNLAYMVYTSGSSGDPKGCMIEHESLRHYLQTVVDRYAINNFDRILQLCSVGFDAAIDEVFSALYAGATLVVKPDDMLQSCHHFLDICEREQLTIIGIYASMLSEVVHAMNARGRFPASVRLITTGGETIRLNDVEAWHAFFQSSNQVSPRFINNYGLSESTIVNLSADLTEQCAIDGCLPIGRPLPGNECRVVDEAMHDLPSGKRGELLLAGAQVGRAYWKQPSMTMNRFITDPSTKKRWFRTGDLAQISPNSIITCHGRIDRQVKLRGIRIELEEIENVLTSIPGISGAACILHSSANRLDTLVAFVSPHIDNPDQLLREELQARLPRSMQPHRIVALTSLPTTERGKIDHRALAKLLNENGRSDHAVDHGFRPPITEVEAKLFGLWEEVLGHSDFGVNESFFDVGGDSINSLALIHLVEQRFNRRLMLSTLFTMPSLRQLSRWIEHPSDEQRESFRSLVCLQSSGDRHPLYVIHGGDGSVYVHLQLARSMGPNRPVYGLQAIGFDGGDSLQASVEQMAAHYASEILRFQPKGPYHLLGYSAGGWYAWAVAAELKKRGADLGVVTVIDTGATADLHRRLRIRHLVSRQLILLPSRVRRMQALGRQQWASQLEQRWINLRFILWTIFRNRNCSSPGQTDISGPEHPAQPLPPTQPLRGDYFIRLHTHYRPPRLPISVHIMSSFQQSSANQKLWDFYTKGNAVMHPCMQEHEDFYDDTKVKNMAILLKEILNSNPSSFSRHT